ncbi:hypothetical protein BT96DRAFT_753343, partial [Gymnopus androsaceus JB14]
LQRNSSTVKEIGRVVPRPVIIVVKINDNPVRALIDSGSLADFMSTSLADQLKVNKKYMKDPIPLHQAIQGSRSKIHCRTTANLKYQDIDKDHYFYIANVSNYDLILGTTWMYMHQVRIGLNPTTVEIGSSIPLPISGDNVTSIETQAIHFEEEKITTVVEQLREYAKPICKTAAETPLPPLRRINHTIPLIDENKIYPWRPSRCPEAFRAQWDQKRRDYISTGRWVVTTSRNTVPMMLIPK